jgi:hypothetical protein
VPSVLRLARSTRLSPISVKQDQFIHAWLLLSLFSIHYSLPFPLFLIVFLESKLAESVKITSICGINHRISRFPPMLGLDRPSRNTNFQANSMRAGIHPGVKHTSRSVARTIQLSNYTATALAHVLIDPYLNSHVALNLGTGGPSLFSVLFSPFAYTNFHVRCDQQAHSIAP